jgi:hypothetical protein
MNMWRRRNPPHGTDRHGRNSIDDFPLVPERRQIIVELVGLDHPEHPTNRPEQPATQPQSAPIAQSLPTEVRRTKEGLPAAESTAKSIADAPPAATGAPTLPTQPISPAAPRKKRTKLLAKQARSEAAAKKRAKALYAKLTPRDLHELHCTVCLHPLRAAIEEEFLHWLSPESISKRYEVGARCIYRHAHATGLFDRRYRNLRSGLGHIAECASEVAPTARDVVRAFHHLARINADGQWIEPPTHVVVSSGSRITGPPAAIAAAAATASSASTPELPEKGVNRNEEISDATR